jgi:hypothetical protein
MRLIVYFICFDQAMPIVNPRSIMFNRHLVPEGQVSIES